MTIDTNTMISITDANQNFSKVTKLVDEKGSAVILKNNAPRYLVIDFNRVENGSNDIDEDLIAISKRILIEDSIPYESYSREELIRQLAIAREHYNEGRVMDANKASYNVRKKYDL